MADAKPNTDDNSVITTKKLRSGVAGYIWESPCLKPCVFNPFLLAAIITLILFAADFFYGKRFDDGGVSKIIQHVALTYVVIAAALTLNNMLIKHRYRLDKYEKKEQGATQTEAPDSEMTSTYVADD